MSLLPDVRLWLRKPATWDAVSTVLEADGHDDVYDLSDDSHRLDVVQIVCEALTRLEVLPGTWPVVLDVPAGFVRMPDGAVFTLEETHRDPRGPGDPEVGDS